MNKNLTDLTIILDRSGSMNSILRDAQGGLDHFIAEQKTLPGECNFTLAQFDTEYDVPIKNVPIRDVFGHTIVPRGGTAMYYAIGRTIDEIGARLQAMPEHERPGLVVVVILTDGMNNSWPPEYPQSKVKAMIEHQQSVYGWRFTYLGANQDAWATADGIGISSSAQYTNSTAGLAYKTSSGLVGRMRSATMRGAEVEDLYTEEEQQAMAGDTTR